MKFKNIMSFAPLVFLASAPGAHAISISSSTDATALANTLFLNLPGLSITGATLSGDAVQSGIYSNASGTFGLPNSGIVLSSGNVANYADGPNTNVGQSDGPFGGATPAQEALLQPITGQNSHNDAVQLDITFTAPADISGVSFFATFGSEEFPEWVGSGFIDGFGLYVNGTNVAGAVPTGGGTPLAININHPDMTDIPGTELDGILAPNGNPVLRFDVPVNSGDSNLFQIILADAGDSALDTTAYLSSFIVEGGGGSGGETEFNPILPSNPPDPVTGEFIIELPETTQIVWVDPPVTVGYEYDLSGDALFTTVTAPSLATVPDIDGYLVTVDGMEFALAAGATLDFAAIFGVTPGSFILSGIDPDLMLDPANPLAFPIGIAYSGWSQGTYVGVTPITDGTPIVPLPAGLPLYLGGLAIAGCVLRRSRRTDAA